MCTKIIILPTNGAENAPFLHQNPLATNSGAENTPFLHRNAHKKKGTVSDSPFYMV